MPAVDEVTEFDFAIVGGGLQGCLVAQAIAYHQPDAKVLLVEKSSTLCGNHTWSFHRTDISDSAFRWFAGLVDHSWSSYEVRLGQHRRTVNIPYGSLESENLARSTSSLFDQRPNFLRVTGQVKSLSRSNLLLDDSREFKAICVFDCRGIDRSQIRENHCGFQKFVGLEVELQTRWESKVPCLMDDGVDQSDGFRFIYSLPFSDRRVLIEDTRFSTSSDFDADQCVDVIDQYLKKRGHNDYKILRQEAGCLPMPFTRSKLPTTMHALGYRGGFFHAATGYSLPLACGIADAIACQPAVNAFEVIANFRKRNAFQHRVSLWLNRMLFQLVKPTKRSGIFERFYQNLSDESIGRFYAHRFYGRDALQLVVGRPPAGLTPIRFLNSFREKPCPA